MMVSAPTMAPAGSNGKAPALDFDSILPELRARPHWVCWKYEKDDNGKTTKKPYRPNGRYASSTTPATWSTFETAAKAAAQFDGIGIVCADGLAGIDLDHCLDDAGNLSDRARSIIDRMDTYTEVTPSGHGLRCLFFGELPGDGIPSNALGVEMYDSGRYFTVTGKHLEGTPRTIEHRAEQAAAIYEETKADLEPPNPLAALVVPASEIAGRQPRPVDWLTHKFIERCELVLITAPPGGMKSLLMLVWAVCVSAGRRWLTRPDGGGGLATKAASVLWLNTDNGESTHADRLGAILRTLKLQDVPLFSITTTDFELSNPSHIRNLHLVADELGAEVIVIDTLSGCLAGVNENDAGEMTVPAAHLRALANAGRTVIGIHHPPKNDAEGSRGSSVLTGKVDRHYTVSKRENILTIKAPKTRSSPPAPLVVAAAIQTDPATDALLGVNFFDGTDARNRLELEETKDRILEVLAFGPLSAKELRAAVKVRAVLTTEAVGALVLARLVRLETGPKGKKIYSLASLSQD
jgi:hypothetical protein